MADEESTDRAEKELHVNGVSNRATTYDLVLRSITTGVAIAAAIGIFVEWRDWRDFKAGGGNRCTVETCDEGERRIIALEMEVAILKVAVALLPPELMVEKYDKAIQEGKDAIKKGDVRHDKLDDRIGRLSRRIDRLASDLYTKPMRNKKLPD